MRSRISAGFPISRGRNVAIAAASPDSLPPPRAKGSSRRDVFAEMEKIVQSGVRRNYLERDSTLSRLAALVTRLAFRFHQGRIDQVLAQEPDLHFVASQNLAHDQIVSSLIT